MWQQPLATRARVPEALLRSGTNSMDIIGPSQARVPQRGREEEEEEEEEEFFNHYRVGRGIHNRRC